MGADKSGLEGAMRLKFPQRELNEKTPGQTGHVKIGRIEDSNDTGNLERNGVGNNKKS